MKMIVKSKEELLKIFKLPTFRLYEYELEGNFNHAELPITFNCRMFNLCGQEINLTEYSSSKLCHYFGGVDRGWAWRKEWLEPLVKIKSKNFEVIM